jgi:hypothetical protein
MWRRTSSNVFRALFMSAGALVLAVGATAQQDQTKDTTSDAAQDAQSKITETVSGGAATVTKSQLNGEVVSVSGTSLVAKMDPGGEERVFAVAPDKKFVIDGQEKSLTSFSQVRS